MASAGIPLVLAAELSPWPTAGPVLAPGAHPANGQRESLLGTGAHRHELLVKLGLRVSPRTVRKYMWPRPMGTPRGDQRWATFLRNHADAVVACDFFVAVTATFQLLYVFVVMEHASRRLLHLNVTRHPSAQWTLQQFREALQSDHRYQYLIHDRDSIFSSALDGSIENLGLVVLQTPYRSPKANALCERLIGSIRRECLDFTIPLSERHLLRVLEIWRDHYNHSRPHMGLDAGIPSPPVGLPAPLYTSRHRLPAELTVTSRPVLGGLHHEYGLAACAARPCHRFLRSTGDVMERSLGVDAA